MPFSVGCPIPPDGPVDESAFRVILFTDIAGSTEVHDQFGDEAAMGSAASAQHDCPTGAHRERWARGEAHG